MQFLEVLELTNLLGDGAGNEIVYQVEVTEGRQQAKFGGDGAVEVILAWRKRRKG